MKILFFFVKMNIHAYLEQLETTTSRDSNHCVWGHDDDSTFSETYISWVVTSCRVVCNQIVHGSRPGPDSLTYSSYSALLRKVNEQVVDLH